MERILLYCGFHLSIVGSDGGWDVGLWYEKVGHPDGPPGQVLDAPPQRDLDKVLQLQELDVVHLVDRVVGAECLNLNGPEVGFKDYFSRHPDLRRRENQFLGLTSA